MAFTVIYDSCVLYPAPLRDLLLRLANTNLVRARWSEEILEECIRNILKNRPDLKPDALERTRELMRKAAPDCMVADFENLIDGLKLPDPNDRHVLAAAIRGGAQLIVTVNLKDFPEETLAANDIVAMHPDDFVLDLIDLEPGTVSQTVTQQANALKNPPMIVDEVLETLHRQGLPQSVARLRELN